MYINIVLNNYKCGKLIQSFQFSEITIIPLFYQDSPIKYVAYTFSLKLVFNDRTFDLRHISYFIDLIYKEIYYLVTFNDYFFLNSVDIKKQNVYQLLTILTITNT